MESRKITAVGSLLNISEKVSHDDLSDSSLIFGTLYILNL
jgi:hypothetical protein